MARLPIITYHAIDSARSCLSTTPELFEQQMRFLAIRRYRTLTVSEAFSCLNGSRALPNPAVALTFDDGYSSVFEQALPLLRKYGFVATAFVVSGCLGTAGQWDPRGRRIPNVDLMGPEEIRELAGAGWEIGSHSKTHARLTQLDDDALAREIDGSRISLQEITGRPVRCFAYPYGSQNARVRSRVSAAFDAACGTRLDYAHRTSDAYALERIDAYYLRSPGIFCALAAGWMPWYLGLRRWMRKARSR